MNLAKKLSEALCRSSLIYDFKRGRNKLLHRFPAIDSGMLLEVDTNTDRAFAYPYCDRTLRIDVMGTSGENFEEKLEAWKRNFRMNPNEDGVPEGAALSARAVINEIGTVYDYDSYKIIDITGHSAGSFISSAIAVRLLKETNHCNIYTQCFAGPPDGNWRISELYNMNRDRWEQLKVINPRDIVTMMFRDKNDKEERGVDIGEKIILPHDTKIQRFLYKWFRKFPSIIEHSPKEYCDGMQFQYPSMRKYLKSIRKEMVN